MHSYLRAWNIDTTQPVSKNPRGSALADQFRKRRRSTIEDLLVVLASLEARVCRPSFSHQRGSVGGRVGIKLPLPTTPYPDLQVP